MAGSFTGAANTRDNARLITEIAPIQALYMVARFSDRYAATWR